MFEIGKKYSLFPNIFYYFFFYSYDTNIIIEWNKYKKLNKNEH